MSWGRSPVFDVIDGGLLAFLAGPLYFSSMRPLLRRLFVLIMSLAFVAGMMQQSVFAANESCPLRSLQAPTAQAEHHGHDHQHHSTPEPKKDAAFAKCCGVCVSTATNDPPPVARDISIAPSRIHYALTSQRFADRPVVPDPGIPKRTA
jgi:hypothetical protein